MLALERVHKRFTKMIPGAVDGSEPVLTGA